MAPLCILREEEQTIDIFSPSVVTVTPFWLLLKIVLTLSFLRHDGEKCLFWVTHMLVFWGFYFKKYKKNFLYKATCKTLFTQWIERETHDRPETVTCKVSCLLHIPKIYLSPPYNSKAEILTSNSLGTQLFFLGCNHTPGLSGF